MAIIGIDLGTTYSVMAYLDKTGEPKIIPNADGENTTPSVVGFLGNEVLVGMEAKEYQQDGSSNIASFFKRSMGDPYFELEFNGKMYNTIDMSAEVLKKLKNDAETFLNEKVTKAVITVPAYFNNLQREATIEAGKKAGLEVLGILNEPTAASIAYGLRDTGYNKHVLVYDLGGGTFDVTISKIEADSITVLSTEGDHNLGGKDFDDLLADYVNNLFIDEHGIDLFDEEGSLNTLLVTVEEVKQKLTTLQRTTADILFDRKRGKYEVTREDFEDLSSFLLERAWSLVDLALENAGLTASDLDEVILVGGSTRMPMIASYVQHRTNIMPKSTINVDEVVAIGAALQANILESQKQKVQPRFSLGPAKKVDDVMSHSLGLVAVSEDATKYINSIMIPKNKTIPAVITKTYVLNTRKNRENTWDVNVTQGESNNPTECTILGKYTVRNIPYTVEQPTKLLMTFGYDSNGVMQIEAKEKTSKKKLQIQVEKEIGDLDWLAKTPELVEEIEPVNVILAIDTSGSMDGSPIDEAVKAANQFISKLDEEIFSIGLLAFADEVKLVKEPTSNKTALSKEVQSLKAYVDKGTLGYGTNSEPLGELYNYFKKLDGKHIVLLLTDGLWFSAEEEIQHSKKLSQLGVEIIAVGTSEADEDFLKEIATSDENALFVDLSELVQSFSNIAQVVTESYKLTSR